MGLNSITRKQLHLAILLKNYNYSYINYNYILFKTSIFFNLKHNIISVESSLTFLESLLTILPTPKLYVNIFPFPSGILFFRMVKSRLRAMFHCGSNLKRSCSQKLFPAQQEKQRCPGGREGHTQPAYFPVPT